MSVQTKYLLKKELTSAKSEKTLYSYYPFGMPMPNRQYSLSSGSKYRFGFNTQEKDDEVYGEGNLMSAQYWEYDTRIGRRWNVDPRPKIFESPYATFSNNPILFTDVNGDTTKLYNDKFELIRTDNSKSGQYAQILNIDVKEYDKLMSSGKKEDRQKAISLSTFYDLNSIKDFYDKNNGTGEIKSIDGVLISQMENITVNGKKMNQNDLSAYLKNQKLGPEYMANLVNINGIYRVDNSSKRTDNDLTEVTGGYKTKTVHTHPTANEIIKIAFYKNNELHKVEIRPSSPDDRADQLNAQFSTSAVVDKSKIYIFNGLNRLQVIKK